jgi:hypothetical protein
MISTKNVIKFGFNVAGNVMLSEVQFDRFSFTLTLFDFACRQNMRMNECDLGKLVTNTNCKS